MIDILDIASCMFDGAAMFGPAVRNSVSDGSTMSKAIDIVVDPDAGTKDILVSNLTDEGFQVSKLKTYKAKSYRRTEFVITDGNGKSANLSVFTGNSGKTLEDVVRARYSADVNRLMMDNCHDTFHADNVYYQAVRNAENGCYKVMDDMFGDNERKELTQNGWEIKQVNNKTSTSDKFTKDFNKVNNKNFNQVNAKEENKKMDTKPNFLDMMKVDGEAAAYRVAATQITNGTKAAILAIMRKQGHGNDTVKAVADMLDTEFGTSLVHMMLGVGLTYAPHISEDARVKKLAGEFRVSGIATAGNAVLEVAMENFLPVVMNALAALPEPAAAEARISESTSEKEEEVEEEEEEAHTPPKRMQA